MKLYTKSKKAMKIVSGVIPSFFVSEYAEVRVENLVVLTKIY